MISARLAPMRCRPPGRAEGTAAARRPGTRRTPAARATPCRCWSSRWPSCGGGAPGDA
ncbi:hypothetical protein LT493_44250 [Streptomyces tricolor]|nr:hypothetical protein [Streptomyces tricolor]